MNTDYRVRKSVFKKKNYNNNIENREINIL